MTPCAMRNNKKTEAAESAAACVGTCDMKNVNIEEVHLIAPYNGSLVYVIRSLYWYLWDNNIFCLVYLIRYSWDPTSKVYIYVRYLCF